MKEYHVIGLMSGTSLDGLDVAYCRFVFEDGILGEWELIGARNYPYSDEWVARLATLMESSAYECWLAHVELARWMGERVNEFRKDNPGKVDIVASHGHTVFHQPDKGLTVQIGDGDILSAVTGLPVVFNFRMLDVALGGQGAPLVPIGDEMLFGKYDACLNLGGFSNISFRKQDRRVAFDISPCNMALNELARMEGFPFDRDGNMASEGKIVDSLLDGLDSLDYYSKTYPKSLGKEWYEKEFRVIISPYLKDCSVKDLLATVSQHIAGQIKRVFDENCIDSVLVTGGGALNKNLLHRMNHQGLVLPDINTINYKEALIFALLGALRLEGVNSCLRSVTGARIDNCGGDISGIVR